MGDPILPPELTDVRLVTQFCECLGGYVKLGEDEKDLLCWFEAADYTRPSSLRLLHQDNSEVLPGYILANPDRDLHFWVKPSVDWLGRYPPADHHFSPTLMWTGSS
jgi:hypothetical protein